MNTERANVGWGFWLAWVLASVIGYGMGSVISIRVSYALLPEMAITEEFGIAHLVIFGTMLGIAGGFLQWLVLREKVARAGWWIAASALGFAVAGGTLGAFDINGNYVIAGIQFAGVFGVAAGSCSG